MFDSCSAAGSKHVGCCTCFWPHVSTDPVTFVDLKTNSHELSLSQGGRLVESPSLSKSHWTSRSRKPSFHGHKGSSASDAPSSERGVVYIKLSLTKSRFNNLRQLAHAVRHRSQRQIMHVEQHGKITNCLFCFVAATDTDPVAQANTVAKTYEQRTSLSVGADDSDRTLARSLRLRSRNPDWPSLAKQTCRSPPEALD